MINILFSFLITVIPIYKNIYNNQGNTTGLSNKLLIFEAILAFTFMSILLIIFKLEFNLLYILVGTSLGGLFNYLMIHQHINYKYVFEPILIFIIYLLSDSLYYIFEKIFTLFNLTMTPGLTIIGTLASSLVLSIILIVYYWGHIKKSFIAYKNNFLEYFDFGFRAWFFGLLFMALINFIIMNLIPAASANNEQQVQSLISNWPWLMLIASSIFAPINEEFVFRLAFKRFINNKYLYIIVSGFIFGLVHVIFSYTSAWDFLYVLSYGALGSAFAYMLYEKDNVLLPMSFHFLHNFTLTLMAIVPPLMVIFHG